VRCGQGVAEINWGLSKPGCNPRSTPGTEALKPTIDKIQPDGQRDVAKPRNAAFEGHRDVALEDLSVARAEVSARMPTVHSGLPSTKPHAVDSFAGS
jgi:hypothetical protein